MTELEMFPVTASVTPGEGVVEVVVEEVIRNEGQ